MISEEQISKELAEIGTRIPPHLKKAVAVESMATPTMKKVMLAALDDPLFPKRKKKHIKILLDTGEFDKKIIREDPKIAKMIDNFIGREINKKIKAGLLPPRSQIKNLKHFKHFNEATNNSSDKE